MSALRQPEVVTHLEEDLAELAISLLLEDGTEYDSHSVVARLDVDGFILTRADLHQLALLWCGLLLLRRDVGRRKRGLKLALSLKGLQEWRRESSALEQ